ncbi:HAD family hydrolase [Promicromonospora umidemergens]|uniref:Hydroxymethylpyrimidine pyrophosphatase-like HAD family hydrolase n=1 Tax=Promicromonospora umidemergens TaxID=629679 RepID=A0ABP8Y2J7_9MICO|nr:HAD family hydrolase [Promicromonospora umidemergens]
MTQSQKAPGRADEAEQIARVLGLDSPVDRRMFVPGHTKRRMVALDIDGTLLDHDGKVPAGTVDALDLVRAAGHEVVLATGRSLVGLMPVATRLGLVDGFAVCSNGTLTVRLDPSIPSGYVIDDARRFDPGRVIRRALELVPGVRVGVEEVGWGWRVNALFDAGMLNGPQKQTPVAELCAAPATRVALHSPGITQHLRTLAATGVTATPAGTDWVDLTVAGTSKATALERLRQRLRIPSRATVAVGDGHNDRDMFGWARRSYAMGHAAQAVRDAADAVTGTIAEHGAVTVLHSLLPADVDTGSLSRLAAQLAIAVHTASSPAVVRVWHGPRAVLARCETWTRQNGTWGKHAPIPAGIGATMRGIETAAREAGLLYPRGDEGRRRAHWHTSVPDDGPAGFELPMAGRDDEPVSSAVAGAPRSE